MKALVYTGPAVIELQDREYPERSGDSYVVKIISNGICGSDVEGYLGKSGRRTPPMIMGHEFSGVIAEAPECGTYTEGQKVTAFPKLYCGECEACAKGLVNICPHAPCLGVLDCDGTFTKYITLAEKYLIPLADEVSFDDASMIEPLAVAVRGVRNIPVELLKSAEQVLVIGAGTIGLLLIQVLRNFGYTGKLVVHDKSKVRLEKALALGADAIIFGEDFQAKVDAVTGGTKFDLAIECVGLSVTANATLQSLKNGGTTVWIGNNQKMIEINMQHIVTSEIKVIGSYTYVLEDFYHAVKLVESGEINFSPIITTKLPLDKGVEAFAALTNNREGKEIKIILTND